MEEKRAKFIKWVDAEIEANNGMVVLAQLQAIKALCANHHWDLDIRDADTNVQRDLRDAPVHTQAKSDLAVRYVITTRAIRQLRELGVSNG